MTCEEFERVVTDLACEFLIEAATRKRGLAHARACSACAARLQQERALTAALDLAASAETAQAPASMKTALLGAFQRQSRQANAPAPLVRVKQSSHGRSGWMTAAAAVLLLLAILVALQVLHRQSQAEPPAGRQPQAAQESPSKEAMPQTNGVAGPSSLESSITQRGDAQRAARNDKTGNPPRAQRRRMRPVFHPELARMTRPSRLSETVTDFIPLTELADATAISSGTIVRVEMPRASLIAMGLPLNAERAYQTVKADIVVGDDGLARAIRLVY
jgi:hypothetical protein